MKPFELSKTEMGLFWQSLEQTVTKKPPGPEDLARFLAAPNTAQTAPTLYLRAIAYLAEITDAKSKRFGGAPLGSILTAQPQVAGLIDEIRARDARIKAHLTSLKEFPDLNYEALDKYFYLSKDTLPVRRLMHQNIRYLIQPYGDGAIVTTLKEGKDRELKLAIALIPHFETGLLRTLENGNPPAVANALSKMLFSPVIKGQRVFIQHTTLGTIPVFTPKNHQQDSANSPLDLAIDSSDPRHALFFFNKTLLEPAKTHPILVDGQASAYSYTWVQDGLMVFQYTDGGQKIRFGFLDRRNSYIPSITDHTIEAGKLAILTSMEADLTTDDSTGEKTVRSPVTGMDGMVSMRIKDGRIKFEFDSQTFFKKHFGNITTPITPAKPATTLAATGALTPAKLREMAMAKPNSPDMKFVDGEAYSLLHPDSEYLPSLFIRTRGSLIEYVLYYKDPIFFNTIVSGWDDEVDKAQAISANELINRVASSFAMGTNLDLLAEINELDFNTVYGYPGQVDIPSSGGYCFVAGNSIFLSQPYDTESTSPILLHFADELAFGKSWFDTYHSLQLPGSLTIKTDHQANIKAILYEDKGKMAIVFEHNGELSFDILDSVPQNIAKKIKESSLNPTDHTAKLTLAEHTTLFAQLSKKIPLTENGQFKPYIHGYDFDKRPIQPVVLEGHNLSIFDKGQPHLLKPFGSELTPAWFDNLPPNHPAVFYMDDDQPQNKYVIYYKRREDGLPTLALIRKKEGELEWSPFIPEQHPAIAAKITHAAREKQNEIKIIREKVLQFDRKDDEAKEHLSLNNILTSTLAELTFTTLNADDLQNYFPLQYLIAATTQKLTTKYFKNLPDTTEGVVYFERPANKPGTQPARTRALLFSNGKNGYLVIHESEENPGELLASMVNSEDFSKKVAAGVHHGNQFVITLDATDEANIFTLPLGEGRVQITQDGKPIQSAIIHTKNNDSSDPIKPEIILRPTGLEFEMDQILHATDTQSLVVDQVYKAHPTSKQWQQTGFYRETEFTGLSRETIDIILNTPNHPDVRTLDGKRYLFLKGLGHTAYQIGLLRLADNGKMEITRISRSCIKPPGYESLTPDAQNNAIQEGYRYNELVRQLIAGENISSEDWAFVKNGHPPFLIFANRALAGSYTTPQGTINITNTNGILSFTSPTLSTHYVPPLLAPVDINQFREAIPGVDKGYVYMEVAASSGKYFFKARVFTNTQNNFYALVFETIADPSGRAINPQSHIQDRELTLMLLQDKPGSTNSLRKKLVDAINQHSTEPVILTGHENVLTAVISKNGVGKRNYTTARAEPPIYDIIIDRDSLHIAEIDRRGQVTHSTSFTPLLAKSRAQFLDAGKVSGKKLVFAKQENFSPELAAYRFYYNAQLGMGVYYKLNEDGTIHHIAHYNPEYGPLVTEDDIGIATISNRILGTGQSFKTNLHLGHDGMQYFLHEDDHLIVVFENNLFPESFVKPALKQLLNNQRIPMAIYGTHIFIEPSYLVEKENAPNAVGYKLAEHDDYVAEIVDSAGNIPGLRLSHTQTNTTTTCEILGEFTLSRGGQNYIYYIYRAVLGDNEFNISVSIIQIKGEAFYNFNQMLMRSISNREGIAPYLATQQLAALVEQTRGGIKPVKTQFELTIGEKTETNWTALMTSPMLSAKLGFNTWAEFVKNVITDKSPKYNNHTIFLKLGPQGSEHPYRVSYREFGRSGTFLVPVSDAGAPQGIIELKIEYKKLFLITEPNSHLTRFINFANGPQLQFNPDPQNPNRLVINIQGDYSNKTDELPQLTAALKQILTSQGDKSEIGNGSELDSEGEYSNWNLPLKYDPQNLEELNKIIKILDELIIAHANITQERNINPISWVNGQTLTLGIDLKNITGITQRKLELKLGIEPQADPMLRSISLRGTSITEIVINGSRQVLPATLPINTPVTITHIGNDWREDVTFSISPGNRINIITQTQESLIAETKLNLAYPDETRRGINVKVKKHYLPDGSVSHALLSPSSPTVITNDKYWAQVFLDIANSGEPSINSTTSRIEPILQTYTVPLPAEGTIPAGSLALTIHHTFDARGNITARTIISATIRGIKADLSTLTIRTDEFEETVEIDLAQETPVISRREFTPLIAHHAITLTTVLLLGEGLLALDITDTQRDETHTYRLDQILLGNQSIESFEKNIEIPSGEINISTSDATWQRHLTFTITSPTSAQILNEDVIGHEKKEIQVDSQAKATVQSYRSNVSPQATQIIAANNLSITIGSTIITNSESIILAPNSSLNVRLHHPQFGNIDISITTDETGLVTNITRHPLKLSFVPLDSADKDKARLQIGLGNTSTSVKLNPWKQSATLTRYFVAPADIEALQGLLLLSGQPVDFIKGTHSYFEAVIDRGYFRGFVPVYKNEGKDFPPINSGRIDLSLRESEVIRESLEYETPHTYAGLLATTPGEVFLPTAEAYKAIFANIEAIKAGHAPALTSLTFESEAGQKITLPIRIKKSRYGSYLINGDITSAKPLVHQESGLPFFYELENTGDGLPTKGYELHVEYLKQTGTGTSLVPALPYLVNHLDGERQRDQTGLYKKRAQAMAEAHLWAHLNPPKTPIPVKSRVTLQTLSAVNNNGTVNITYSGTANGKTYELGGFIYNPESDYLVPQKEISLSIKEGARKKTSTCLQAPSPRSPHELLLKDKEPSGKTYVFNTLTRTLTEIESPALEDAQLTSGDKAALYTELTKRKLFIPRTEAAQDDTETDIKKQKGQAAYVSFNTGKNRISALPLEARSFIFPDENEITDLDRTQTADFFKTLKDQGLSLNEEVLLPDEESLLAMTQLGNEAETFSFIGQNIILRLSYKQQTTHPYRYQLHHDANPTTGIADYEILIKNPVVNNQGNPVNGIRYYRIREAQLISKRESGIGGENITLQIPTTDQPVQFDLNQFSNTAHNGFDNFAYQLLDKGKKPDEKPDNDLKYWQKQVSIARDPDYRGVYEPNTQTVSMINGDGMEKYRFHLSIEKLEGTYRNHYLVSGFEFEGEQAFIRYENGAEGSNRLKAYTLPNSSRPVLYLQNPQGEWFIMMIGHDGSAMMWKSNRSIQEYQQPVRAHSYPNTGINTEYKASHKAFATRNLSNGVATITAVLSQFESASTKDVVRNNLPRIRLDISKNGDDWIAELGRVEHDEYPATIDSNNPSWPFHQKGTTIEIVEDTWMVNGTLQKGKVRVVIKGIIKNGDTEILRPYATLVFKNADALLNHESPLEIDYVHYHKTIGYTDKKLLPSEEGFISSRAGIPTPANGEAQINWGDIFELHDADGAILKGAQELMGTSTNHAAMAPVLGALQVLSAKYTGTGQGTASPLPVWVMSRDTRGHWGYNDYAVSSLAEYILSKPSPSGSSDNGNGSSAKQTASTPASPASSVGAQGLAPSVKSTAPVRTAQAVAKVTPVDKIAVTDDIVSPTILPEDDIVLVGAGSPRPGQGEPAPSTMAEDDDTAMASSYEYYAQKNSPESNNTLLPTWAIGASLLNPFAGTAMANSAMALIH